MLMNTIMQLRKICNHPFMFQHIEVQNSCASTSILLFFYAEHPVFMSTVYYRKLLQTTTDIREELLMGKFNSCFYATLLCGKIQILLPFWCQARSKYLTFKFICLLTT